MSNPKTTKNKFFGANAEVIEAFLKQTHPCGENGQGNLSFKGLDLFSYNEVIGEIHFNYDYDGAEPHLVLIIPNISSTTTKKHIAILTKLAKAHGLF